MKTLPRLALFASIMAFIMAGLTVLTAVLGPIVVLPMALIPLCSGLGIIQRKVWAAYGFAVYLLAQLLLIPVVLLRSHGSDQARAQLTALAVFSALGALLFLLAGKSLAKAGATRGRAFPWIAISALTVLPLLFIEPFAIPTGAMEDTILVGDRIMVRRIPSPLPARGEMMAFTYPIDRRQTFIKRIAGMPGDRLRIAGKVLYRNDAPLSEPYAVHKMAYEDSFRDNFPSQPNSPIYPPATEMLLHNVVNGDVVVPPGKYFMLGDNRDQSLDSRYWGFIDSGDMIGKPLFVYDSADQTTEQTLNRDSIHRGKTRWNRLFKSL